MSEAGAAARRVREAAAIALPIQLGRAAVETAIEAALVAMVARGRLEWAAALAAARLIEELTLGSATDHATTRALDRRDPWARIGDGVRAGLLRTGLPLALLIAPAIVIARGAMLGQVRVVLAAATVGLVAMIAAIALHLKHGTA